MHKVGLNLSSFNESSYLDCFNDRLSLKDKHAISADCSEFHPPSTLVVDDVWGPLKGKVFPHENVPEVCFALGNILQGYDFTAESRSAALITYLSSLYLFGSRVRTSGIRLESLAIRISIECSLEQGEYKLLNCYASFLRWLIEEVESDPSSEDYFLKLGLLLLLDPELKEGSDKYRQYMMEIGERMDKGEEVNLLTDSASCPCKWNVFLEQIGSFLGKDMVPFRRLIPNEDSIWS